MSSEVITFPYGAFLKVRLEFVLLRNDELEARIMRIIESWMIWQKEHWEQECAEAASNSQSLPPEPDYYVTLSYAQIVAQLLYKFNSSRKGEDKEVIAGNTISRSTLSKAMQSLIEDGYVLTRPHPDATQYKLNCPLIEQHMRLLPKTLLGSNGRIDGIPCLDFFLPPEESVQAIISNLRRKNQPIFIVDRSDRWKRGK
jgi:hypothetical protein